MDRLIELLQYIKTDEDPLSIGLRDLVKGHDGPMTLVLLHQKLEHVCMADFHMRKKEPLFPEGISSVKEGEKESNKKKE